MQNIKNSTIADPQPGFSGRRPGSLPRHVFELQDPDDIGTLTPWQVDFRQLDPGPLSTQVTIRANSNVSLTRICLSGRVHQRGLPPDGWTTLGLVPPRHLRSWQKADVGHNTLLCFGHRDGFDSVSEAGFDGRVLSFETGRLSRQASDLGFDLPPTIETSCQIVAPEGDRDLHRLSRQFRRLLDDPDSAWTPDLEEALALEALTFLTAGEPHLDKSRANTRARAIDRALDMMVAHSQDPVSISEICEYCGVTWRTLNRAFKERFGVGPKTYYTQLRLKSVRDLLLKGTETSLVVDAANRHGFWHMGQFAQDYRRFFGELPSLSKR